MIRKVDDCELTELEALLQTALSPVPPRRNYERELHHRLSTPHLEVAFPSPLWPRYFVLLLSAMTVGLAAAIILARLVMNGRLKQG